MHKSFGIRSSLAFSWNALDMSLSKSESLQMRIFTFGDGKDVSLVSSSTKQSAVVSYNKRTDNKPAEDQVLL